MQKLLKQYPDYVTTLKQDEIDFLLKQNPHKLEGGYNITGLKNAITHYHCNKNRNWGNLMLKYFNQVSEVCLADQILTGDMINDNQYILSHISKQGRVQYKMTVNDNLNVLNMERL